MKPTLLLFIALNLFSDICYAQFWKFSWVKKWDKAYGGIGGDGIGDLIQTKDGGFLIAGGSGSPAGPDKSLPALDANGDFWLLKIDSNGNRQWDRQYGGLEGDGAHQIIPTADGGYVLGGISYSGIGGDKLTDRWYNSYTDIWVIKIDSNGIKQWERTIGTKQSENFRAIQQTKDGGYLIGTSASTGISGDKTRASWQIPSSSGQYSDDYWIVKLDATGRTEWDKTYGGLLNDHLMNILALEDGGSLILGASESNVGGDKTADLIGDYDYWLLKLNSAGNIVWQKTYGGSRYDFPVSINQTNGGYLLCGTLAGTATQSTNGYLDYWLLKIDTAGNPLWNNYYGGFNEDGASFVRETSEKGFVLVGKSSSRRDGSKTEDKKNPEEIWIVKTDSNRNQIWDKTLFLDKQTYARRVFAYSNGCYLIACTTEADSAYYKTVKNRGGSDIWLIKFCDTLESCKLTSPQINLTKNLFCGDDSVSICAPSGYQSYLWNTGRNETCIHANLSGNYYLTVTDVNGCSVESNKVSLNIFPQASVSLVVNGDTLSSFGASSYQWYHNGNKIDGATNAVFIVNEPGSYTLEITDGNGCTAMSAPVMISGIDEIGAEAVSIYPNPSSINQVQLIMTNNLVGGELEVFDANGRRIFQTSIRTKSCTISLPVSKGVYFIRIHSERASVVKCWVRL